MITELSGLHVIVNQLHENLRKVVGPRLAAPGGDASLHSWGVGWEQGDEGGLGARRTLNDRCPGALHPQDGSKPGMLMSPARGRVGGGGEGAAAQEQPGSQRCASLGEGLTEPGPLGRAPSWAQGTGAGGAYAEPDRQQGERRAGRSAGLGSPPALEASQSRSAEGTAKGSSCRGQGAAWEAPTGGCAPSGVWPWAGTGQDFQRHLQHCPQFAGRKLGIRRQDKGSSWVRCGHHSLGPLQAGLSWGQQGIRRAWEESA